MKFPPTNFAKHTLLAIALTTGLTGCSDPEYPTPTPVTTSAVGQAQVLVVNAAPGTAGTTITVDATAFGPAIPYLGTSALTPLSAGSRLLIYSEANNIPGIPTVTPPPATPPVPVTVARPVVARTSFLGGTNYTIFLTDSPTRPFAFPVTATSDQGGIRTVTLTDNLAAPVGANNAKIRFVNLAPSSTYGIFNTSATPTAPLFTAFPTRAYRATSASVTSGTMTTVTSFATFSEVPAGAYDLDVRSNTTTLAGTQQTVTFAAGKIYTLYVRGLNNSVATPLGISVVQHN